MTEELPTLRTIYDDRRSYRIWKRILHHAGKRRAFDLIEPKIRVLAKKIRNRQHPFFAGAPLERPTDRKRKLLNALTEIRDACDRVYSREIADELGVFVYGVTGTTLHVLWAGGRLVQAMLAARGFELHLMQCLTELAELDYGFVQDVGLELRDRPTFLDSRH